MIQVWRCPAEALWSFPVILLLVVGELMIRFSCQELCYMLFLLRDVVCTIQSQSEPSSDVCGAMPLSFGS